jgi:hypothetical protein
MAGNPFLAMVALRDLQGPSIEAVADRMQSLWPSEPLVSSISRRGAVNTFQFGPFAAALTHFPQAMPWQYLEGPCDCAWYWPEAAATLRAHPSHVLIHLLDQEARPVERAMALTRLLAATAQASDALGIFWGPGRLVHPAKPFIELALAMTPSELPLYLWIDFRVEAEVNGSLRLFTTGLEPLGQLEIEVAGYRGDVGELRANVYNVAHYMLEGKKPINHGQSLGSENGPRMIGEFGTSLIDLEQEVLHLKFEE